MSSTQVATRRIILLDWSRFIENGIRLLLASAFLFAAYLYLLGVIRTAVGHPLESLVMTLSHVLIGVCLVAKYRDLGADSRALIRLLDPSSLGRVWHIESRTESHAELNRIIERWREIGSKQDIQRVDDLTDVGFFAIVASSLLLGMLDLVIAPYPAVQQSSVVILVLVSAVMYWDGFRTARNPSFQEAVDQLEYLLQSRLRVFERLHTSRPVSYLVRWRRRGNRFVVYDIGARIGSQFEDGSEEVIAYWSGLPSKELQRFEFHTMAHPDEFIKHASGSRLVTSLGWIVSHQEDLITVSEGRSSLSLHDWSSFMKVPEDIQNDISSLQDGLGDLQAALAFVCS